MANTGKGKYPLHSQIIQSHFQLYPWVEFGNKDTTAKVIYEDFYFDDPPPPSGTTGQIKVYLSGSFQAKPIKWWSGSSWVVKPLKRWNGSSWVITPY